MIGGGSPIEERALYVSEPPYTLNHSFPFTGSGIKAMPPMAVLLMGSDSYSSTFAIHANFQRVYEETQTTYSPSLKILNENYKFLFAGLSDENLRFTNLVKLRSPLAQIRVLYLSLYIPSWRNGSSLFPTASAYDGHPETFGHEGPDTNLGSSRGGAAR